MARHLQPGGLVYKQLQLHARVGGPGAAFSGSCFEIGHAVSGRFA